MRLITEETLRSMVRPRPEDGHKGTFGHALIVAGRYAMAGASVLAAKGCMRSGVGKLTVHVPLRNNDILQLSVPEAILHHDVSDTHFTSPVENLEPYQAVAIGPGIGTSADTVKALGRQLSVLHDKPCILDADALNCLSLSPSLLSLVPAWSILTPHPGEYARLAADTPPAEFAGRHEVVLALKGHPTRIYTPDGDCWQCPWGNSGMGTAGSGDVLTGVAAAMLAQGYTAVESAVLSVSVHAMAGDAAAAALGEHSLIASDIIDYLHAAFKRISGVA